MTPSSARKTFIRMQDALLKNPAATCLLVEVLATQSQNVPWEMYLDDVSLTHENIRRISIDKFYEIVTGNPIAFKLLCEQLPRVIEDVVGAQHAEIGANSLLRELQEIDSNMLRALYVQSFKQYTGFEEFNAS